VVRVLLPFPVWVFLHHGEIMARRKKKIVDDGIFPSTRMVSEAEAEHLGSVIGRVRSMHSGGKYRKNEKIPSLVISGQASTSASGVCVLSYSDVKVKTHDGSDELGIKGIRLEVGAGNMAMVHVEYYSDTYGLKDPTKNGSDTVTRSYPVKNLRIETSGLGLGFEDTDS
jgi:hypothetical protein